jgi:hypothetical protein
MGRSLVTVSFAHWQNIRTNSPGIYHLDGLEDVNAGQDHGVRSYPSSKEPILLVATKNKQVKWRGQEGR